MKKCSDKLFSTLFWLYIVLEFVLCQSPFFNKVAGNFIKKETLAKVFSSEFCEVFKSTFFTEHLRTTASVLWQDISILDYTAWAKINIILIDSYFFHLKVTMSIITARTKSRKACQRW